MTPKEMLYELELSVDRVSSKNAANLPLPAKVVYINRGIISFVLNHYEGDKIRNKGFEESRRRTDELQRLVVPHVELKPVSMGKTIYQVSLSDVPDYMFLLRRDVYASKCECKNQRLRRVTECQTDDLNDKLINPHERPDFKWRACLERTADNKIEYYTDGTFSIDKVVIDYLRYPKRFDVRGYKHFDGSLSTDVPCELPDFTHPQIVTLAALEFDWDLNNPGAQSKAAKLQLLS